MCPLTPSECLFPCLAFSRAWGLQEAPPSASAFLPGSCAGSVVISMNTMAGKAPSPGQAPPTFLGPASSDLTVQREPPLLAINPSSTATVKGPSSWGRQLVSGSCILERGFHRIHHSGRPRIAIGRITLAGLQQPCTTRLYNHRKSTIFCFLLFSFTPLPQALKGHFLFIPFISANEAILKYT